MPNVSYDNGMGAGAKDSSADMNVIPEVAVASKVTDNFYWGVGIWGTAGMGTDYRTEAANFKMVTNLQLMQFGLPLAYKANNMSFAFTPILQYGALDMNYDAGAGSTGAGIAQDLKFGYNLGVSYEIDNLTLGAVYKSRIDMDYKNQLSVAMAGFGVAYANTELSTPAELGVGASYTMGQHTVGLDYKKIKWSDAKGYKDFMWEDQNVYAIGYEYKTPSWELRVGYNHASSPISDQGLAGTLTNTLNLLGFPAITESHYAVGATYIVSTQTSVDLGLTYAAKATQTYTAMNPDGATTRDITTEHSQTGITAQINFAF
jgi:long-chain fatty acid transport protein